MKILHYRLVKDPTTIYSILPEDRVEAWKIALRSPDKATLIASTGILTFRWDTHTADNYQQHYLLSPTRRWQFINKYVSRDKLATFSRVYSATPLIPDPSAHLWTDPNPVVHHAKFGPDHKEAIFRHAY